MKAAQRIGKKSKYWCTDWFEVKTNFNCSRTFRTGMQKEVLIGMDGWIDRWVGEWG